MSKIKGVNKTKTSFSIDISVVDIYEKYCDDNDINKSKLMNKIIIEFLKTKNLYKNEKSI